MDYKINEKGIDIIDKSGSSKQFVGKMQSVMALKMLIDCAVFIETYPKRFFNSIEILATSYQCHL